MKGYLAKLNLRPQERRFVVFVGLIVFIVLNMFFVWPHFDDWAEVRSKMDRNRQALKKYQDEIGRRASYEMRLQELQKSGSQMLTDELQLSRIVDSQAIAANLFINNRDPRIRISGAQTNQFFEEQALSIQFTSGGKELVDFLVNIAAANAMIRVRELNVKPDPSQTKLVGNIVFVANYQKKGTAKPDKPEKMAAATPRKP